MDKTENQSGFFLELRTRLQSGLLVLSKDLAKDLSEVQLLCGPSSLEIKTPGCLVDLQLPAGVTIIQDSCREVPSAAGDGLHIRMQLHADQDTEAPPSLIESLKAQKSYCLVCQSCGEQVLMERVFNRVLPLPNGNWNALVDDWCCHPDPFAKKKLLPRKEDCLLGDTFILLSWERDNNGTLTQEPETLESDVSQSQKPKENVKVICKNCRAVLGEEISPASARSIPSKSSCPVEHPLSLQAGAQVTIEPLSPSWPGYASQQPAASRIQPAAWLIPRTGCLHSSLPSHGIPFTPSAVDSFSLSMSNCATLFTDQVVQSPTICPGC
ncbi:E3 ubiquitin-protein ligase E3D isoform X2 [Lepisosteus oculatus]|uniref:E3 ubiquitin-protein ligase E3D isoform X2 n=1 Tax=Lepisosteus oculatus TaxID=7918 RepID=UPI0035F52AD7